MSDRIAEIRERWQKWQDRAWPSSCVAVEDIAFLLARLSAVSDALDREGLAQALFSVDFPEIAWADASAINRADRYRLAEAIRGHVLGEEQN